MTEDTSTINDTKNNQQSASLEESLAEYFEYAKFPDSNTIVTGDLTPEQIVKAADAGVEHVINLQSDDELKFDEKKLVESNGMHYTHLPIAGAKDLKQLNLLEFDKALRIYHGKKTLMHCSSGNRVGACIALRAGWLRGRKMDTAMQRGKDHGLTGLEEEVRMRLLVPR